VGDPDTWCWFISIVCVFLTLFLSVINQALRGVLWVKLEEAFTGSGKTSRTQIMRDHCRQMILSVSILRLLVNLVLLLTVVYAFLADGSGGTVVALLKAFILTGLILSVFSIALPSAIAKYVGTSMLAYCYPAVRMTEWLSRPLTFVLQMVDPVVKRLAGASAENSHDRLEEQQEELLSVVEEREKEGVVDEEEKEMIASVLEFRDTTAGEIMTPRTEIVGIESKLKLTEVVELVVSHGHSRYPVYEESIDNIIGVLYAKDLLLDINQPTDSVEIGKRLRNAYFVPESKCLRDLLHDFQNQKVHMAVVLDEYGGTAGVVTFEDILEELVGEIVDEHEPPQTEPVRRIDDHTIDVDARCEVDELNDEFNLNIPEDQDYETLGGFAFAKLGYIPLIGQEFVHENMTFTVTDAQQRKINRLRIVIKPPQNEHQGNNDK